MTQGWIKKLDTHGVTLVQPDPTVPEDVEVIHEELPGQPPVATTKGWGKVPGRS
jgi:hypothetical protein